MNLLKMGERFIAGLTAAGCANCKEVHLVASAERSCPSCGHASLTAEPARVSPRPPERVAPFTVTVEDARKKLRTYARAIWFRTAQLDETVLIERLQRVWVPLWLVDTTVRGQWQADAGFDYQVKSRVERYAAGTWTSQEVTDTRIRWEPRLGEVTTRVENVPVDALTGRSRIEALLGRYSTNVCRPFVEEDTKEAVIWLPDLSEQAAWPNAETQIRRAVGEVCRTAAAAEHIREVYLRVNHDEQVWTWLLLPLYTTWYEDDSGNRWALYIHGQTGKVGGPRWASVRKGALWAGVILTTALLIGLVGVVVTLLGLLLGPLALLGALVIAGAFLFGCLALWPLLSPWSHNYTQASLQPFPPPKRQ